MSALAMFHAASRVDTFDSMMRSGVDVGDPATHQQIRALIREATPTHNDVEQCLSDYKVTPGPYSSSPNHHVLIYDVETPGGC